MRTEEACQNGSRQTGTRQTERAKLARNRTGCLDCMFTFMLILHHNVFQDPVSFILFFADFPCRLIFYCPFLCMHIIIFFFLTEFN